MARLREEIALSVRRKAHPRLAVVRAGGLGDTLLTLPTLQFLLEELPAAEITLIGSAWAEALRPLIAFPLRLLRFDSPLLTPLFGTSPGEDPTGVLAVADAVVIYGRGPDENLARNARRYCRGPVIEWPVEPSGAEHAAVHFARAVADPAPGLCELPAPALRIPGDLQEWSRRWLATHLASGERPVAVHPGSGRRGKCWPAERFARLMRLAGGPILLIEGPADKAACRQVARLAPPDIPMAKATGMGVPQAAALLVRCRLYVGSDSGLTHLAAAVGVPTAAVFGPTDPRVWGPRGRKVRVVSAEPPRDAVCPENLWPTVEQVNAALECLDG